MSYKPTPILSVSARLLYRILAVSTVLLLTHRSLRCRPHELQPASHNMPAMELEVSSAQCTACHVFCVQVSSLSDRFLDVTTSWATCGGPFNSNSCLQCCYLSSASRPALSMKLILVSHRETIIQLDVVSMQAALPSTSP